MREAPRQAGSHGQVRALAVSIVWMLAVQLACVVLWQAGWLTRTGALSHWLLVGVLPPAVALWTSGARAEGG